MLNAKAMSDISKVSSFYCGNKVFVVYLHKSIQFWSFSSNNAKAMNKCHSRTTILGKFIAAYCYECEARVTMQKQWTSDISKVSSFYYGSKVFVEYLHKSIQFWSFSSSHSSCHYNSWDVVVAQVVMAAATGWRIAKHGKCGSTLVY